MKTKINRQHRHMAEFVRLKCAPDLLAMGLFPNAKEITESMAAYDAMRNFLMGDPSIRYDDPTIALISVGDGHTPRTAALFAMRTKWQCYSVDPVLRIKHYPIDRLRLIPDKVEHAGILAATATHAIIVMVHSHAPLRASIACVDAPHKHVITIPCCVAHDLPGEPYIGYTDPGIWSPRNTVKIWKDVK